MRKLQCLLILFGIFFGGANDSLSANATSEGTQRPQSELETEVKQVVNGFFSALEIRNQPKNLFGEYVIDDFLIFEMGTKLTLRELLELFHTGDREWISSRWVLSDFRISLDKNSAHASYLNTGEFIYGENGKIFRSNLTWLESVYLIRQDGKLKIRFLQSDDIEKNVTEVDPGRESP
jgi:hypothetical protein